MLLLYVKYISIFIQANAENVDDVLNVKDQVKHKIQNLSKSERKKDLSKLL